MNENSVTYLILAVCLLLIVIIALKEDAKKYISKNASTLYEQNVSMLREFFDLGKRLSNNRQDYFRYIDCLGVDAIYNCSSSVVHNASQNPTKYVIKYSNIEKNQKCLEYADFCCKYISDIERLRPEVEKQYMQLEEQIPSWVRFFSSAEYIVFTICNVDMDLLKLEAPIFEFSYVSPAGQSGRNCCVRMTSKRMNEIVSEISASLTKSGHKRVQRSAMTNDLRDAIKLRDNYTCCICGNSVYNEPNLLLEVDHIIPVSRGGKTEASNLQTLCWRCNRRKSNSM